MANSYQVIIRTMILSSGACLAINYMEAAQLSVDSYNHRELIFHTAASVVANTPVVTPSLWFLYPIFSSHVNRAGPAQELWNETRVSIHITVALLHIIECCHG